MIETKDLPDDNETDLKLFKLDDFDASIEEEFYKKKSLPEPEEDDPGSGLFGLDEFDVT